MLWGSRWPPSRARPALDALRGVDVEEEEAGGLRLMERMTGYDRAVPVDAAVTVDSGDL